MPASAQHYDYDAVGNRTSSPLSAMHGYVPHSRLTSDDEFTYTYDANGNLRTRTATAGGAVTTYHWDSRNELVQIDFPTGPSAYYRYDALGRRVEKEAGGQVRRYVYDREDIALETDGGGTLLRRYRHGSRIDQPLVLEDVGAGESFFYHADHLGSVRLVTDEGGQVVCEYDYDAYGRRTVVSEGIEQPYSYTGREYDGESGLYYYRARYYDARQGRFLSEDPIGFGGGDPNFYRYARNNPVNWSDPFGLDTVVIITIGSYYGYPIMDHAALYVDNGTLGGPELYDPAGSYEAATRGSDGKFYDKEANLQDYLDYHRRNGDKTKVHRFPTTPEQEEQISQRSDGIGDPRGFSCASSVSDSLRGTDPFKDIGHHWRPGELDDALAKLKGIVTGN